MEQDSDFQIRACRCIEWKTKLPNSSVNITSPTFTLPGSEWNLRISRGNVYCSKGVPYYDYTLSLIPKMSESVEDYLPFSVGIHERNPANASKDPVRWQWYELPGRSEKDIWKSPCYSTSSTSIELGEKRFVCLFYVADAKTKPENTVEKCVQVSSEVPRDIESLSSDFSHLLEKEILPDVKLECGGRTFQAHRSVLAARSEVFRAMFQNGMLESETGAVKIQDMDVEVLERLVKFVYTGKPEDISESTATDLYEAADKYAVHSLKAACVYWIERNLTEENCVKYLVVADSHSDRDLKAAVVKFILDNPSLMKSEAWIAFSKKLPLLAIDVLHAYVATTAQ